jgi:ATP-dependent helicase HrpA
LGWAAQELTEFAGPLFQACQQVRQRLAAATDPAWKYAVAELGEQLAQLLCPGFLSITPRRFLVQYPRYLQAMVSRLDRLSAGQLERDEAQFAIIHPRWRNLLELLADQRAEGRFHLELEAYRWLLEEYRARVFGPTDAAGARPAVTRECLDAHWSRLRFE